MLRCYGIGAGQGCSVVTPERRTPNAERPGGFRHCHGQLEHVQRAAGVAVGQVHESLLSIFFEVDREQTEAAILVGQGGADDAMDLDVGQGVKDEDP